MINYSPNDINREFARSAYYGTSFSPEKRGDDTISGYINEMQTTEKEFSQWLTPENEAAMTADLEAYRLGYLKRLNAYLSSHSRLMSTMIAGPSNFPVDRQRKRGDVADKRRDEWLKWNEQTLNRLRKTYNPRLASRVIYSDDAEAIAKLQAKIDEAEQLQATMKAANAIIRKKLSDEEKVAELSKLEGITEKTARKLLEPGFGGKGFPSYMLTNNNANKRRMEERIKALEAEAAKRELARGLAEETDNEPGVTEYRDGIKVYENTDIDRLQILFPGKPNDGVRATLKSRGFNWSGREKAWQRLLNDNARMAAKSILDKLPKSWRE